jgi:hypothetical protein
MGATGARKIEYERAYYHKNRSVLRAASKKYFSSPKGQATRERYYQRLRERLAADPEAKERYRAVRCLAVKKARAKLSKEEKTLRTFKAKLKKQYGLSVDEYNRMAFSQGGGCLICGSIPERFYVDHRHSDGVVRGLLCCNCNVGLGMFKENKEVLARAIDYLNKAVSGE